MPKHGQQSHRCIHIVSATFVMVHQIDNGNRNMWRILLLCQWQGGATVSTFVWCRTASNSSCDHLFLLWTVVSSFLRYNIFLLMTFLPMNIRNYAHFSPFLKDHLNLIRKDYLSIICKDHLSSICKDRLNPISKDHLSPIYKDHLRTTRKVELAQVIK